MIIKAFVDVYLNCSDVKGAERQLDRSVGRTNTGGRNGRMDGEEKKTKVKGITIHTMKVNRGSRVTAPLILNLDTRWR